MKALAGFQLKDASYTVQNGNTAYFVETMRDDPNDQEENLGDDGVVTVDRKATSSALSQLSPIHGAD